MGNRDITSWERPCLHCGTDLSNRQGDAVFCDQNCRRRAEREGKWPQPGQSSGETKRCTKCGEVKPLTEYSPDDKGRAGRRARCRACMRAARRTQPKNRERLRRQGRASYRRNREAAIARSNAYRRQNRQKARAYAAVAYALKTGVLIRPRRCENCGENGRLQGHHHDYTKRLEVEWLCSACHNDKHRPLL